MALVMQTEFHTSPVTTWYIRYCIFIVFEGFWPSFMFDWFLSSLFEAFIIMQASAVFLWWNSNFWIYNTHCTALFCLMVSIKQALKLAQDLFQDNKLFSNPKIDSINCVREFMFKSETYAMQNSFHCSKCKCTLW